jgi:hypothetical protein
MLEHFAFDPLLGVDREQRGLHCELVIGQRQPRLQLAVDDFRRRAIAVGEIELKLRDDLFGPAQKRGNVEGMRLDRRRRFARL